MATRPVFITHADPPFYKEVIVEFKFYTGFATKQKLRSIESLHNAAKEHGIKKILEVSSKSSREIGRQLSAFNLKRKYRDKMISIESLFQGSKLFENGKKFENLYAKTPLDAKRDPRLKKNGMIVGFEFEEIVWGNEPKTAFYEWLYISTLAQFHIHLLEKIVDYQAFSDIEFNPKKSLNCQARAVAMALSLYNENLLYEAIDSKEAFLSVVYPKKKHQRKFCFSL